MSRVLSKRDVMDQLLRDGQVLVLFNIDFPGVSVPPIPAVAGQAALRFGYGLVPEIFDLATGPLALSGTLSFGGTPIHCVIPWEAILGIGLEGTRHSVGWPPETPVDIQVELPKTDRPKLTLVP